MVGSVKETRTPAQPYSPPWCTEMFFLSPPYGTDGCDAGDLLELNPCEPPQKACLQLLKENGILYNHNMMEEETFGARYIAGDGTLCDIVGQRADADYFDVEQGIHHVVLRIRIPHGRTLPNELAHVLRQDDYTAIDASSTWTTFIKDLF